LTSGVDFALVLAVIVLRVDLEDFHDQRRDVLDVHVERHRGVGCELRLVGECEIDVDPFL